MTRKATITRRVGLALMVMACVAFIWGAAETAFALETITTPGPDVPAALHADFVRVQRTRSFVAVQLGLVVAMALASLGVWALFSSRRRSSP